MEEVSRRQFLFVVSTSFVWAISHSLSLASSKGNDLQEEKAFPTTIAVLTNAYILETKAYRHCVDYSRKALEEKHPNVAYLFEAVSLSEKIHADNYKKILVQLGASVQEPTFELLTSDTKANLKAASKEEQNKIEKIYPDFFSRLRNESHDQAVISCMYSWKSHQQHKRHIDRLLKYFQRSFGVLVRRMERIGLDFHVCEICGATLEMPPKTPCQICNYPMSHYKKVPPPRIA